MRVVATAGHVDHGKSTLVQALTGMDPDRLLEEKSRGLTIDLGFAWSDSTPGAEIAFVDVPGHARFIRNMIAGIGSVDACLFVVAANEGWMPQSEEHLQVLELLGVPRGIIALTKAASVDADLLDMVRSDVKDHVQGTALASAPLVAVDAPSGLGVEDVGRLLGELPPGPGGADLGRPRLWVDRSFAIRGSGTVVTGTLTGGGLDVGARLCALPGGQDVRVRGLHSLGTPVSKASAGSRVAVNVAGVATSDVGRGAALVEKGHWRPTRVVDATLSILDSLPHQVTAKGAFFVHVGTGSHRVRLRLMGTSRLEPGATATVRMHLSSALPLLPGDRYVMRENGRSEIVGGGEILDVAPVLPVSKAQPSRSVDRVVAERGWVDAHELEVLTGERRPLTAGRWIVSPGALASAQSRLRERVVTAGAIGLDLAVLGDQDRAILPMLDDVTVDGGRIRPIGTQNPLDDHPFVQALEASPFNPPAPQGVDSTELRELVRRAHIVKLGGIWFSSGAMSQAADVVALAFADHPDGLTVSQARTALGTTRRFAIPILGHLDSTGVTKRVGDVRVPGPQLPRSQPD